MEKELRAQIDRLQEDKNYNDQMYREVCEHGRRSKGWINPKVSIVMGIYNINSYHQLYKLLFWSNIFPVERYHFALIDV